MKKILTFLSVVAICKVGFSQKVTVSDTIKMQLTGPANYKPLHKMIKYYMDGGWQIQSAETNEKSNTYVWKLQKVIVSKRKQD